MPSNPENPKIDELKARLESDPGSRIFFPLAEELRKAGKLEEAERVLRAGIEGHPAYLSAWVSLGRVLSQLERHNEAVLALNRALQIDPENVVAARLAADSYLVLGEKVEAIKKYKLVHAFIPSDQEVQASIETLERQLNPEKYTRPIRITEEPLEFREVAAAPAWQTEPQDRFVEEAKQEEEAEETSASPLPASEGSGVRDPFDGPEEDAPARLDEFSFDDNHAEVALDQTGNAFVIADAEESSLTPDPSPAGRGEQSGDVLSTPDEEEPPPRPMLSIVRDNDARQRTVRKLHRWLELIQRGKRPHV